MAESAADPRLLQSLLTAIEAAATIAFALSGLLEAARKRLDAVGVCVVAGLAAFGGGTLRDVLLDRRPFFWVEHAAWLWALLALPFKAAFMFRPAMIQPLHGEVSKTTVYRVVYALLWPVLPLFKHWWKPLLLGNAGVVACFAIFYLSTTFALAQGTGSLGFGRTEFLSAQLAANLFLALGILVAAVWSDRIGPARVLARGMVLTMVVGAGFGAGLYSGSLLVIFLTLGLALFAMGLCYGPLGGWLPTLFPVALRYSGISIAFSAGGVIGGALVPMAATALAGQGQGLAVGLLMSAAALLSLLGVLLARPAPDGAE